MTRTSVPQAESYLKTGPVHAIPLLDQRPAKMRRGPSASRPGGSGPYAYPANRPEPDLEAYHFANIPLRPQPWRADTAPSAESFLLALRRAVPIPQQPTPRLF